MAECDWIYEDISRYVKSTKGLNRLLDYIKTELANKEERRLDYDIRKEYISFRCDYHKLSVVETKEEYKKRFLDKKEWVEYPRQGLTEQEYFDLCLMIPVGKCEGDRIIRTCPNIIEKALNLKMFRLKCGDKPILCEYCRDKVDESVYESIDEKNHQNNNDDSDSD